MNQNGKILEILKPEYAFSKQETIQPIELHVQIGVHEAYAIGYGGHLIVRSHIDEQGTEWKVATLRIINSPEFEAGDCVELYFRDGTPVTVLQ